MGTKTAWCCVGICDRDVDLFRRDGWMVFGAGHGHMDGMGRWLGLGVCRIGVE